MSIVEVLYKELIKDFNCAPITPPLCAKKIGYFLYKDDIEPDMPVNTEKEFVDILDDDVQSDIRKFFETNVEQESGVSWAKEMSVDVGIGTKIHDSIVGLLKKFGINIGAKIGIEIEKVRKVRVELSNYFRRGLDETDIERYAYSRKFKIHPPQVEKYEGKRISLIYGELVMRECNICFYDKIGAEINAADIINVDPKYIKDGELSIKAMENCKDGITIGIYATDLIGKDGFFVDDEELRGKAKMMERGIGHRNDLIPYMSKMNMLVINLE